MRRRSRVPGAHSGKKELLLAVLVAPSSSPLVGLCLRAAATACLDARKAGVARENGGSPMALEVCTANRLAHWSSQETHLRSLQEECDNKDGEKNQIREYNREEC